ncbi:MAG: hypothetical protein RIT25_2019 [Planctomycetota bacterium]
MRRLILFSLVLTCLLAVIPVFVGKTADWTGEWDTSWGGGGGRIILQQEGDSVTGEFPLLNSRIEGKVLRDRVEGRRIEGGKAYSFVFLAGVHGRSFHGRDEELGWWTGTRVASAGAAEKPGLATPRAAFVSFVSCATQARCGLEDHWARAAHSVEFDPQTAALPRAEQLRHLQEFFDLVDLTTFRIWELAMDAPSDDLTIELKQSRSGAVLPLKLHRNAAGEWRIVVPNASELAALRKSLLAGYGDKPPTAQSYKHLHSPRDAMRAFLEGMADWNGRGKELALSAMDLTEIPEAIREQDGQLAAAYLCRALYQIGFTGLQSIPNDPAIRDPFVFFEHAAGSIVLAPNGPGADAPWQFTAGTLWSIAMVYCETASLEPAVGPSPGLIPPRTSFALRELVVAYAPLLLYRLFPLEFWQVIALLIAIPSSIFVSRQVARVLGKMAERSTASIAPLPSWFVTATTVALAVFLLFILDVPGHLGIREGARKFSAPLAGLLFSISLAALAWHLVTILCLVLMRVARRSKSAVDDLAVNLLHGSLRAGIIAGCVFAMAYWCSIPATNVLAGIGIGGLGVAFASRETIAHFFGAGVLVADRPFRAGDWIQSSLASGFVESVGIRSTRVRTAENSIVIVPNGSLAAATIVNLGTQRPRTFSLQILVMQGANLEKVERFVEKLRGRIDANPAFHPGRTTIGVSGIATNGIQIQCSAVLAVASDQAEAAARHEFLVEVMDVADKEGIGLGPQLAPKAAEPPAPAPKP